MGYTLRPYQERVVSSAIKYFKGRSRRPGVLVAPTGSGKSLIAGSIVKELKSPCLILQPSKEILLQNYEKAVSFGLDPKIYSASCKKREIGDITYATIKSIKKDVDKLIEIGVGNIIIDECHASYSAEEGSEFMSFISKFKDVKVLGLTATPCKLRSYASMMEGNYSKLNMLTKDKPRYFEKMVDVIQIKEMIDNGYWARLMYEVWDFDDSELTLNSTGAEYTQSSIESCVKKNGINNGIYKRIMQLLNERKHILVCMDSVESCEVISNFINKRNGRISDFVTSKTTNKRRGRIIEEFKEGKLRIVFNYSALATGFDFPELDCVIFGRPTFSFAIYYQFVGRGVRPHPNKKDCLFVDCCNNYSRFGAIENVSIEEFPGVGWAMFSGDKLITGIRMGDDVNKGFIMNRNMQKLSNKDLGSTIMKFGKYEGTAFRNIPMNYFQFLVNNLNIKDMVIREYYFSHCYDKEGGNA